MAEIQNLSNEQLLSMMSDEDLQSLLGERKELKAPLSQAPGLERVQQRQEERPGIFSSIGEAGKQMLQGGVIAPTTIFQPSLDIQNGMRLQEDAPERLVEQFGTGLNVAAIPFRYRENAIAKPIFKLASGEGLAPGDFVSMAIGNKPTEMGDFADVFFSEQTPTSEMIKGTVGLAMMGAVNPDKISKVLNNTKGAAKNFIKGGNKKILAQHKILDEGIKEVRSNVYDNMSQFINEANTTIDKDKFASAIKVLNAKTKGALTRSGGKINDIKDAWKAKASIGKEMKTIWSKRAKGETLTSSEQLLYDTWKGIDDVIGESLTGKNIGKYRAMKGAASEALEATGLARGVINTSGGRAPDIRTLKKMFEEGSENNLNIMNNVGQMNQKVNRSMQIVEKMAKTSNMARNVKGLAQGAAKSAFYAGLIGSIGAKFARGVLGDVGE